MCSYRGAGETVLRDPWGRRRPQGTAGQPVTFTWPRISPFGFFFVCTFTYVDPCSIAFATASVTCAVPI